MKTILISFADTDNPNNPKDRHFIEHGYHRNYKAEVERLFTSAVACGLSDYIYYDMAWLKSIKEYKEFPKIFAEPPYGWSFKPLSIWYTLNAVEDGDNVLYTDSNHYVYRYPDSIINTAVTNNIYTYDHTPYVFPNGSWTYRDMFKRMGCDEEKYWSAAMLHANVVCVNKNDFTMKFVEEWKNYCCDYETLMENKEENLPSFKDHRHDQSVFSILAVKYNLKVSPMPDDEIGEGDVIKL